jgi:Na+/proline symporter
VQAALGLTEPQRVATMVALGALTAAYTAVGGYKAAVWTNVVKSMILAGVVSAVLILAVARVEGGWPSVWRQGWQHDKFAAFDLSLLC